MAARRRYTKREKVAAIVAADASSTLAASEATGVPESTLRYWLDQPEFAELRENAREGMAEDALMVARLAWKKLGQAIAEGKLDARDLVIATGMATDKSQLLGGKATERTETRDLTLDDHESEVLGEVVRAELARRSDERSAVDAVVGAGEAGAEGTAG